MQRCLPNLNAAPNTPHGFLLVELSKTCKKRLKTGILLRKTLHFLINSVHCVPQKQENDSERFNFNVRTLNVVNPKFVQLINSQELNSGINTNKAVARLV